jgi:RimJ/RimL family protein N-acetyltransferase
MQILETNRLILRAFTAKDAADVQCLANDRQVSKYTSLLPYPYRLEDAHTWIGTHAATEAQGRGRPFAVIHRQDGMLMGAIGLVVEPADRVAMLGYWLGRQYWGQGYATEASLCVVGWGFTQDIVKIAANVFENNTASAIVLTRCGLRREGILRSHVERDGLRLDVHCYGRLREVDPG